MSAERRGAEPAKGARSPRELALLLESLEIEVARDQVLAAPPDVAQACGLGFERLGGAMIQIATGLDVLQYNRAMGLGVERPATPDDLDAPLAYLEGSGIPRFFVALCPQAQPAALASWLRARGLERYNQWAKLWRDASAPPPVNTRLHIERIDHYQAAPYGRLVAAAFQFPEIVARWVSSCVGRAGWSHYLAFDRATPVATAAMFVSGETAYLAQASTQESHRGQGAQHALIARRIRDAMALGCRTIAVDTAEDTPEKPAPSFRNLKSMGFQLAYLRPNYIWKSA